MTTSRDAHLRVAIPFDAESFNEVWRNYTGAGGYFAANNIYSRLVVLDVFDTGKIHPDLAQSWDILEEGGRYIFHLNPAAQWHDGVPVTAHDVVYTYVEVLKNRYHGLSWLQDIETITAIDDHTVDCRLQSPNAAFLAQLGSFVFTHIIAKHLYDGTDWETNPHNLEPVGSGPFKFERWVKGDRIELVANEEYWAEGPYVGRLTYHILPDREEAWAALERGDVHFSVADIPARDIETWRAKPGIDVMVHAGNALAFISFNWTQELFQDRRVREAIARAINRREIAEAIYPDIPTPTHYYLERITWAFNPHAEAPAYDPARAAELLDEAGLEPDADGVRLRLRLASRSLYPHYGIAAGVMKEQLEKIGIVAEPEVLNPVDWAEKIAKQGDFDLAIDSGDIGPDPQQMASFLTSDGPRNIMRYESDIVDEAFRLGRSTADRERRGEHYRRLQSALAADIARVPFMQYGEFLPYRTEFTGWSWSDGVRGTVPFWYHGKVRPAE